MPQPGCQVVNDKKLGIPAGLVQEWRGHETCGTQFQKFLDGFLETYEVVEAQRRPDPADTGGESEEQKRKRQAEGSVGGTPKKPRVALDSSLVIAADQIDKALLAECKISGSNKDSMWLQSRANNCVVLLNKGNNAYTGNEVQIAGFGKGGFKMMKSDADFPQGGVELNLAGSKDLICFNGQVQLLGDVLKELRSKNPDTKVTYFKLNFDNEDPHAFVLHKTHRVVFVPRPEEKQGEVKEMNAACRESPFLVGGIPMCVCALAHEAQCCEGIDSVETRSFLERSSHCSSRPCIVHFQTLISDKESRNGSGRQVSDVDPLTFKFSTFNFCL